MRTRKPILLTLPIVVKWSFDKVHLWVTLKWCKRNTRKNKQRHNIFLIYSYRTKISTFLDNFINWYVILNCFFGFLERINRVSISNLKEHLKENDTERSTSLFVRIFKLYNQKITIHFLIVFAPRNFVRKL